MAGDLSPQGLAKPFGEPHDGFAEGLEVTVLVSARALRVLVD